MDYHNPWLPEYSSCTKPSLKKLDKTLKLEHSSSLFTTQVADIINRPLWPVEEFLLRTPNVPDNIKFQLKSDYPFGMPEGGKLPSYVIPYL